MGTGLLGDVERQFTARIDVYDGRSAWILDPALLAAIVAAARVAPGARLLDVCCGTGAVAGSFDGLAGLRVGVDLTVAMLDRARTRLNAGLRADACRLPLRDAAFDVVVSRQALHFFDEPALVIREMNRVLRVHGRIVLAQRVPWGGADEAWMETLVRLKQPNLRTFVLERHLVEGLEEAGARDVERGEVHLFESINDWVESPEVPPANRSRILDHCRNAPDAVRAVHPIEVSGDRVRACWRWLIVAGRKG